MGLKCGIVGLPNVGKSTLFNALSSAKAESANYPFCTIEPNVGVVQVPDPRLEILKELVNPQQVLPAIIEFVDIAGLVKGASKGEGLGNKFLGNIREVDAIIHVVRCFKNDNIVHVDGTVNPKNDKEIIDTELQIKDLESIEKKITKTEKLVRAGEKDAKQIMTSLLKFKNHLEAGLNARSLDASKEEKEAVFDLYLLTGKPVIYLANVDESSILNGNDYVDTLRACIEGETAELLTISAAIEADIAEMDNLEDRQAFLSDYGLLDSGLNVLIRTCYKLLGLATYFTAGEKEVRAWTIKTGMKAPQAAGVIHSDFEKGFIRAEVIKLNDYQHYKTEHACRESGKLSVEGKDYVVEDGDIMHFRFNV